VVVVNYLCSANTKDMLKDTKILKGKGQVKTPEVKFNLKAVSDKNKATLICAVFRYNNQRLVYSTQQKIQPSNWNFKTQTAKTGHTFYDQINEAQQKIKKEILNIYKDNNKLSIDSFKTLLDIKLERKQPEQTETTDFTSYFSIYIDKMVKSGNFKHQTIQKFRSTLGFVKGFRAGLIPFEAISVEFKNEYVQYRYNNEKSKCNSQNTLNKDMECIKNVLKQAFKEKLHTNEIFKDEDFSVSRKDTSIFALTEKEVNHLHEFDFSMYEGFQMVVDWFIVSCWSALRWSDFTDINPEHIIQIDGKNYIEKNTFKTNTLVTVPIDQRLYSLLEKYEFKSPKMTNKYFNDTIKKAFEIARMTDTIIMNKNIKGQQVGVKERKCDIVSAHDGRRTWATINYLKGYPIGLLMQVTGHSQESTFLSYVGATSKQKAMKLNELMSKNK
jgi:integrase